MEGTRLHLVILGLDWRTYIFARAYIAGGFHLSRAYIHCISGGVSAVFLEKKATADVAGKE